MVYLHIGVGSFVLNEIISKTKPLDKFPTNYWWGMYVLWWGERDNHLVPVTGHQRLFKWSWHLGSNYTTQYWSHYYALWSWENELAWNEEKVPALITGTSGHALPGISSPLIIFWIISDTSGKLFCSTKFYLKLTITTGFEGGLKVYFSIFFTGIVLH